MLFAVIFTDKPGHGGLRAGLREAVEVLYWSKALPHRKALV